MGNYDNQSQNFRVETTGTEALASVVVEYTTFLSHKSKLAAMVPVAEEQLWQGRKEGSNYCQETKSLAEEHNQRSEG